MPLTKMFIKPGESVPQRSSSLVTVDILSFLRQVLYSSYLFVILNLCLVYIYIRTKPSDTVVKQSSPVVPF